MLRPQGSPFAPTRALLHPLWWAALAFLALNDHVLKHSVWAGVLTGKLSDVAGLLVAGVLAAVVLQARTRPRLGLALGVVAAVFAAVKLSSAAAALLVGAVGLVGVEWTLWTDPTDLLALPALAASAWLVVRTARRTPSQPSRREAWAMAAAGAFGLLFCVATSATPPPHARVSGKPDHMRADAFLVNLAESSVSVHIAMLSEHIPIDCDATRAHPKVHLRDDFFTQEGLWHQALGEAAAIWPIAARNDDIEERGCYAVILTVEGSEPVLAFWKADELPVVPVPMSPDPTALPDGAIVVEEQDGDLKLSAKGPVTLVHW